MEDMNYWHCKAGFAHVVGGECDHIVQLPAAPVKKHAPLLTDDFYSPEATAMRRKENKVKYLPAKTGRKLILNPMYSKVYTLKEVGGIPEEVEHF